MTRNPIVRWTMVLGLIVLGAACRQEGCDIKGNISADGERIYHVPGARYYNRTRIDESRGERWFCSEEEARAAGWRKSKV